MRIKFLKILKKNIYWRINKYKLTKEKEARYNIKTKLETIDKLLEGYSISRYGDGELSLIYKKKKSGINYQEYNNEIKKRLVEILKSNTDKHLVAIPSPLIKIDNLEKGEAYFWSKYYLTNKKNLETYLDKKKIYYDSMISRFYMPYSKKEESQILVKKIKTLFTNRNVNIIEGEYTRFGLGNTLLKEAGTIERIICPSKNAYKIYDKILERAKKLPKDSLVLIALGPTATILAYDLAKYGYQAIDIGHLDIEYEWYLMKTDKKVDVENKAVNEVSGVTTKEIKNIELKKTYDSQIIDRIEF
ncbi:MAG: GT-D fold domain-containing glycosyltransferase [Fusobacterium sp.]|uniref:GT-D fold domain-containing glycosyltransferase n=1 Tax=Fusobacterium sp. TaxID=68766 RepID=UPI0026DD0D78|nr:GT-D fold domain-containing glycosyltransferase [Fusobacterium sp.]MDO4691094.1 GT-D fold domain-containing glycosyltransferase [Fusobacterium sp.]